VRECIAKECELESPFSGDIEVDESFIGARRAHGKRGCGAREKPSFSDYKQQHKNCPYLLQRHATSAYQRQSRLENTIHSDGWKDYNRLGYKKHYRVQHGNNEFANSNSHINGIENYWGIAIMRLEKF
jgi:transposase